MTLKISFLKAVDALFGVAAVRMFSPPSAKDCKPAAFKKFLIIRPGGIGDAVLLVPCLQAIRNKFPQAEISILAERRNSAVFKLYPLIDHLLHYDSLSGLVTAISGDYDVVIDTEQSHYLSAVVARLSGAAVLIGFGTNERSRLFNHQVAYSQDDYEVQSFLNLLEPLGIMPGVLSERFLEIPSVAAVRVNELLAGSEATAFVTIFPGASIAERRWSADRFRRVAEMLRAFGIAVVVVGGAQERELGNIIVAGGIGLNLAGQTSLAETAAVIDRGALTLSGDSGILHIAVALGKPTVSLFGPGRAEKWAPTGEQHMVINKVLPCSPCTTFGTTPPCRKNAACMREIMADEVFNAITILLTGNGAMPSCCCKKDWIEVG